MDTFSGLGNSKSEVLSVLDLKDAFYSIRLSEDSKRYCGILPYFRSTPYLYQRMPMGLNISPSIWQSYINTILECLQSRKHCEAIMDNLLLFTHSKKAHITFNGKVINLPKSITVKLWDKFKVRQMMGSQLILFHLMLKQRFKWFMLDSKDDKTENV